MSKQIDGSTFKQSRASKIQVEVKEIAKQVTAKNISSYLHDQEGGGDDE